MITESSIVDRLGIQDTIHKYALYIDRHQIEDWVSLFTRDGVLDERCWGLENNVGHEAIRTTGMILKNTVKYAMHHITTVVIEELTQTEARGVVFSIVEGLLKSGFHASYHVIYDDRYVKVDGTWLFKERIQRRTFDPVVFANPEGVPT
jgi:hypothetical protein